MCASLGKDDSCNVAIVLGIQVSAWRSGRMVGWDQNIKTIEYMLNSLNLGSHKLFRNFRKCQARSKQTMS